MLRNIIQMGFSGFGDRMRVLCSCLGYAERLGCGFIPVWNDLHWGDHFGEYFELSGYRRESTDSDAKTYPEYFQGIINDRESMLLIGERHRKSLLYDPCVPGDDPDIEVFVVSRYNMKPGGYESCLKHIRITDRLRKKIQPVLAGLPGNYECTHIRNTDKGDLLWKQKLLNIKDRIPDTPQVVITDSMEVKAAAPSYGIICVSDIPLIKPDRGLHHINSTVLETSGFSKRRLNDGLLTDIFVAGCAGKFNPFTTESAKPGFSTSRFSDFINAGRKYKWFTQQEIN